MKKVHESIISSIRTYFAENRFSKAVIGLSGGLDSSVAAALVAEAIGNDNVFGLLMPETGVSSDINIKHAEEIAKRLKIRYDLEPINRFLEPLGKLPWKQNKFAIMNTKSRIRAVLLYNYSNTHDALVIGTGNKSEIYLGYCTKFGDSAVDIQVIGDLWKTEVVRLAKYMGLPDSLVEKVPTAELMPDQTDEQELGAKYDVLDEIMKLHLVQKIGMKEIVKKGFDEELVRSVIKRIKTNKHKRTLPFNIEVQI